MRALSVLLLMLHASCDAEEPFCREMHRWIQALAQDTNAVEITQWSGLTLDLRYATSDNMAGQNLYCGVRRAFVHKACAYKLQRALVMLTEQFPGYRLCIWDAARPLYAQEALRAKVRGTSQSAYVSSPGKGSLHNFGMALDVTIQKPDGVMLDMGSNLDELSLKASAKTNVEDSLVQMGELSSVQVNNRRGLRQLMRQAGFIQLPSEWWHYNAAPSDSVHAAMEFLGK